MRRGVAGFGAVIPALLLATVVEASSPMNQNHPIQLLVARDGEMVDIRVLSSGAEAAGLRYTLSVEGGSSSTQSGLARLSQEAAVLCHLRMSASTPWRAQLRVTGDGRDYRLERSSLNRPLSD